MTRKFFSLLLVLLVAASLYAAPRKAKKITVQIDDTDEVESVSEAPASVMPVIPSSSVSTDLSISADSPVRSGGQQQLFSVIDESQPVEKSDSVTILGKTMRKPFFRFGVHTHMVRKLNFTLGGSLNFQFVRSNTFHTYAYLRGEYFFRPLGSKSARLSGLEFEAEPGIGLAFTPFRDTSFRILFSAELGYYMQWMEFSNNNDKLVLAYNGMMVRPAVSVETFGLFGRYVEFGVFYQVTFFNSYKDYNGFGAFIRF